jgi:hypothetical protein
MDDDANQQDLNREEGDIAQKINVDMVSIFENCIVNRVKNPR